MVNNSIYTLNIIIIVCIPHKNYFVLSYSISQKNLLYIQSITLYIILYRLEFLLSRAYRESFMRRTTLVMLGQCRVGGVISPQEARMKQ